MCACMCLEMNSKERKEGRKKQDSSVSGRKRAHAHKRQPKRKNDDENVARFLKKIMPIFVSDKKKSGAVRPITRFRRQRYIHSYL